MQEALDTVEIQAVVSGESEIGILVYAGLFLAEDIDLVRIMRDKVEDGVTIRILLGDPDSEQVALRGAEEGIAEAMAAKIRNVIVLYRLLLDLPTVEIRLHTTVLYNSIYRADNEMLVNPHVYGGAAAQAPVLHLQRHSDGDLFTTDADSFERVWTTGLPAFHPRNLTHDVSGGSRSSAGRHWLAAGKRPPCRLAAGML